ncbi:MAG: AAA family ATPase [Armatimonadetes bacterium]|nr:AAA family ATPase [Armatimonadota bacterium]
MKFDQQIEYLVRSRHALIYVQTAEERRAETELRVVAERLKRPLHVWTNTQGLLPPLTDEKPSKLAPDLEALTQIWQHKGNGLFMLKDFHASLNDSRVIRLLRDLNPRAAKNGQTLLIVSPVLKLPVELEKEITVVEMPLPDRTAIEARIRDLLVVMQGKDGIDTQIEPQRFEEIVLAAQGLTMEEIENVCLKSFVQFKALNVEAILEEKQQIVRKSGVLEYYASQEELKNVGGMDSLKEWLRKRRASLTDKAREFGLPAPKGMLLLGVQGCGKSLVAKSIATLWGLPMLRFDVGRVFGSLVGSSEQNMRMAIRTAEAVAPCVLWIDEMEKAFAGVQSSGMSDSGTTARVFATFLTWLQEKKASVFVVATANDVSLLPPELLRKGRFDEIFFIDLPTQAEREAIFTIHIAKRKRDPKKFNLKKLGQATEGFSGAEIEQIIVAGLFSAFDAGRDLTTDDLQTEAANMVPLSVMMREEIDELRSWAKMRARPASGHEASPKKRSAQA